MPALSESALSELVMNRRSFAAALASLAALPTALGGIGGARAQGASGRASLLVSAAEWASLAARRAADPDLERFVALLLDRARKDLDRPLLERKLDGRRLLGVSREFIRRTLQWAFAFRATGDAVFRDRARQEMLAVAAFADWNPSHFLDVAEMTAGMAIGYDWLRDALPPDARAAIRRAIVDKGIGQARNGHPTFRMTNNWNQVCIGGMVLGALAVKNDEPDLARDLLAAARSAVLVGLRAYAPDGAYPEGPSYWSYGTSYSVLLVAALRNEALPDWGVLAAPGFVRSAEFYAHSIGPSGKHFNFADGSEGQELPSPIVYLARELNQPALLAPKREMIRKNQGVGERFAPLAILWWPAAGSAPPPPLSYVGEGPQPVAIWRTSWADPNALYFAVKGGGAAHNHGHMDAGSFVLDMDGLRWAKDLGMQDYLSLESRGIDLWSMKPDSPRWKVFRIGSDSHNTLTVADQPHSATAMASLRRLGENEVSIDLAKVLGVRQATRRVRFSDDAVALEDAIEGVPPGRAIRWAMCTEADIRIDGATAILAQKGKSLRVRFAGDAVRLEIRDIAAPRSDIDHPNPNTRQLIAAAPAGADSSWRLGVRFSRD
jgi:oligo-alginate lyase